MTEACWAGTFFWHRLGSAFTRWRGVDNYRIEGPANDVVVAENQLPVLESVSVEELRWSHGQNLRDLLAPLGVYRWEGSFQWGELQSEGEALDQVAEQVALLQREMNLYTAQAEGLTGLLELLGLERAGETLEELRQTVAALLRIGGDSFTLAAMNDTLRGCGIPAQVEETEDPLEVVVSFPGVEGIPAGFEQTKARIEEILPCHLLVKYQFSDSV